MSVAHVLDHVLDHMIISLVTTALHSPSSIHLTELSWLNTSSGFLWKRKFFERQKTKILSRNLSRDFFHLRWASPPGST